MPGTVTLKPKTFLFLQGPPGVFARKLGNELRRRGHRVLRVNFCVGDWLNWRGHEVINYRGRLRDWPGVLRELIDREGVTDLLYYADRHPYHSAAIAVAGSAGIRAINYEYGYFRPDFLTFERGGMSAYSHFPADPGQILDIARNGLPPPNFTVHFPQPFAKEAINEIAYNLSNVLCVLSFPHYQSDRFYNPFFEYLSWLPKLFSASRRRMHAESVIADLLAGNASYFVFPLQQESDYQIRANSPFPHLRDAVRTVIGSFAASAPADARLVIKAHPLQSGMVPWQALVNEHAKTAGVQERVQFIDGGDLNTLLEHAQGVVLVNSTVGFHALQTGCPVKVLGVAVFDIPGLSFQGPLDEFWNAPTAPDAALRDAFARVLIAATQVKGNFYHPEGRAVAVREAASRLIDQRVNEPGAFVDPPPRLERARTLGIPVSFGSE